MSERKTKRLGEENSALIHQVNAIINARDMIGSANKQWLDLKLDGGNTNDNWRINWYLYQNVDADDFFLSFKTDLPLTLPGGHNLVITDTRIALRLADADDYLDRLIIYGHAAYNDEDVLVDDGTNRTAAGLYTYGHADQTVGSTYQSVQWYLDFFATGGVAMAYIQAEMYYTE